MGRRPWTVRRPAHAWPDPDQELLLRAALLPAGEAHSAWRQLRPRLRLDRVDPGSQRLLPLLWAQLTRLGIDDPLVDRLHDAYGRTVARNAILFRRAARVLRTLGDAGIEALVLKGAALALAYYGDPGLRPMADLDVLVRPGAAAVASDVLRRCGWSADRAVTPGYLAVTHAETFRDPGRRKCDLHWRL
ncbi:MAG TPA: nucleotidyltransferase family protein, partial [Methylomirabilota bacterium]|nr:nucleotidyltransferase family protein [Methylomirabilota bacterium]